MTDHHRLFDTLDSKTAMILGFIASILVIGTIGFIFLLILFLRGGASSNTASTAVAPLAAAPAGTTRPTAAPTGSVNVGTGHFPVRGNVKAKVKVIEFGDFRCPYCERFYQSSEKSLKKDYIATGKIAFYFRSFAFLGPASTVASEAAECANAQGKFWKFHDWLYENQASESNTGYYSKANLITYATNLGLNKQKFASCLNSDKYASQVQKDLSEGEAAGVSGTPTFFINGKTIVGAVPYAQIKQVIDAALAK